MELNKSKKQYYAEYSSVNIKKPWDGIIRKIVNIKKMSKKKIVYDKKIATISGFSPTFEPKIQEYSTKLLKIQDILLGFPAIK